MKQNVIPFTAYQKLVILILALTQFTVILDFMILSPLGDMLMKSINLKPAAFGMAVSAYAFSSGTSGLLTAGFADKFDRKKLLLFFYMGFCAGTLFCGLSHDYTSLLLARILTGLFGGVIGSIGMAIITDLFPLEQRGRVLGFVQMGFGASQVLGVPLGIFLASAWGWQFPFFLTALLAGIIALAIMICLKPLTGHLGVQRSRSAFTHLWQTVSRRDYRIGFTATAFISIGGFMMMPFGSVFAINNLRVAAGQLPVLFMSAGLTSLLLMPLVGRLSDKTSKFKLFAFASAWMMAMCVVYSNLPPTPFWLVIILNMFMMIGIINRTVPASALISAIPKKEDRGAFMSINASLTQIAGGIAASVAGMIVTQQSKSSPLEHYNTVGYLVVIITMAGILLMSRVNKMASKKANAASPVRPEEELVISEGY